MVKNFTSNVADPSHIEIPSAKAYAQPIEEHASTTDGNQAADKTASTRAEEIPAAEETARATTSVAPEESARPAEDSITAPKKLLKTGQLHQLCLKKLILPPLLHLHLYQAQFFLLLWK